MRIVLASALSRIVTACAAMGIVGVLMDPLGAQENRPYNCKLNIYGTNPPPPNCACENECALELGAVIKCPSNTCTSLPECYDKTVNVIFSWFSAGCCASGACTSTKWGYCEYENQITAYAKPGMTCCFTIMCTDQAGLQGAPGTVVEVAWGESVPSLRMTPSHANKNRACCDPSVKGPIYRVWARDPVLPLPVGAECTDRYFNGQRLMEQVWYQHINCAPASPCASPF